ncbi:hypothetical protein ACFX2H_012863 [Malus domestica]
MRTNAKKIDSPITFSTTIPICSEDIIVMKFSWPLKAAKKQCSPPNVWLKLKRKTISGMKSVIAEIIVLGLAMKCERVFDEKTKGQLYIILPSSVGASGSSDIAARGTHSPLSQTKNIYKLEAAYKNELGSKIKLDRQFHEKSTQLEKLLAKKRETEHSWGVVRNQKVEHMHNEEKRKGV